MRGRVSINQGAREALVRAKASLLSSGVIKVEGDFQTKDVVSIIDSEGRELARGLINFGKRETEELIQHASQNKSDRLQVLVTRNNIVLRNDNNEDSN